MPTFTLLKRQVILILAIHHQLMIVLQNNTTKMQPRQWTLTIGIPWIQDSIALSTAQNLAK